MFVFIKLKDTCNEDMNMLCLDVDYSTFIDCCGQRHDGQYDDPEVLAGHPAAVGRLRLP